ncbi:MAG TPA: FtsX-like permease family protein, partial [Actinopolymorphaceae bacterium]
MRTVFLASLRTHLRRYVAATVAVVVSVTFVVVVGMLAAGARGGAMASFGAPYRNADHVVTGLDTEAAIALTERLGEAASPLGHADLPASAGTLRDGETAVGSIAAAAELRWQKLVSGRFPRRPGEAVVDVWVARTEDIAIGDTVRIGEDATATDIRVVGLVEKPATAAPASVYDVTWPQLLAWRDRLEVTQVAVRGEVGPLPEIARVRSAQEFVDAQVTELTNRVDTLALLLMLFAAIAVFVSVLVVANTFSILCAQRLREFALLRCLGATRQQVAGSVRREAAAVGVVASLIGLLVGVGTGYGVIALIDTMAPTAPMVAAAPPVAWLVVGFAVGVTTTVVASWLPTRRVIRVSPLAALCPENTIDGPTGARRGRLVSAGILLAAGLVLLGVAVVHDSVPSMLAGGGAVFTGVLLLGPVLVPRLVRVAGAPLGPVGRLATENVVRNPRRAAATTASLSVGLTLTIAVLTGVETANAALTEERDRQHPVDVSLTSLDEPVPADLLDRVRETDGVDEAVAVDGAVAEVTGLDEAVPVVTASDSLRVARDGGAFARVEPGTIRFDQEAGLSGVRAGERVTVSVGDRRVVLRVDVGTGWGPAGVVAPATLADLSDSPAPYVVWVRAAADADAMRLLENLKTLADTAGVDVDDELRARAIEDRQLAILLWSVLGLLGMSVVIALIGIANTLSLSVLERAREHALLRALGLTRGQVRRMLAVEAVVLSVVAALLGTVIGVGFAWVGLETFVEQALPDAGLRIPWPSLGVVVLVAAL